MMTMKFRHLRQPTFKKLVNEANKSAELIFTIVNQPSAITGMGNKRGINNRDVFTMRRHIDIINGCLVQLINAGVIDDV